MDICLITDKGYYQLTLMCINDIIKSSSLSTKITFHLITDGSLNDNQLDNFSKLLMNENNRFNIKFYNNYNLSDYIDLSKVKQLSHVSVTALYKFLIPLILKDLNKVLYLDGDIKVVQDIGQFWDNSLLNNKLAAVVQDFCFLKIWPNQSRLCKEEKLFCSGQMLLDLDKCRKFDLTNKCIDRLIKGKSDATMDQSIFNIVLENQVNYLPPRYMVSFHKMIQGVNKYDDIKLINELYHTNYDNIYQLISDAILYHFHGNKTDQLKNPYLKKMWNQSWNEVLFKIK